MSLTHKEKEGLLTKAEAQSRRSFLKKAAYAAPTIVALGALTKPTPSKATDFGPPPSGPVVQP